ncbi:hypothetical protein AMECASPLE_021632 [Ameca splendens]|uniref:Uncharacterized protein n=1 Tax=Ameca splendens TaxID=208324 RepID=A0ABV0YQH1_9TELE
MTPGDSIQSAAALPASRSGGCSMPSSSKQGVAHLAPSVQLGAVKHAAPHLQNATVKPAAGFQSTAAQLASCLQTAKTQSFSACLRHRCWYLTSHLHHHHLQSPL